MPLAVRFENGEIIEADLQVWVVALIQSLTPRDLATVAEKAKKIKSEPHIIVPGQNGG